MATFVLNEKDGREKTALSSEYAQIWFDNRSKGTTIEIGLSPPPLNPARPNKPELAQVCLAEQGLMGGAIIQFQWWFLYFYYQTKFARILKKVQFSHGRLFR